MFQLVIMLALSCMTVLCVDLCISISEQINNSMNEQLNKTERCRRYFRRQTTIRTQTPRRALSSPRLSHAQTLNTRVRTCAKRSMCTTIDASAHRSFSLSLSPVLVKIEAGTCARRTPGRKNESNDHTNKHTRHVNFGPGWWRQRCASSSVLAHITAGAAHDARAHLHPI